MRFPSIRRLVTTTLTAFTTLPRTALSSNSASAAAGGGAQRLVSPFSSGLVIKSMPTIPFLGSFFSSSSKQQQDMTDYPVKKSDDEWKAVLNKEQFRILREKGTEYAGTGEYYKHHPDSGVYNCAGCNAPLYKAHHKFKSNCGWPAYFDALPGAVTRHTDNTWGMQRIEIVCSNCGGHLGHVFKGEGYDTPTDERHCVNSVSLKFSPEDNAGESKA